MEERKFIWGCHPEKNIENQLRQKERHRLYKDKEREINGEGSPASLRCLETPEMLSYVDQERRQRTWHSDPEVTDLPREQLITAMNFQSSEPWDSLDSR